MGHEESAPIRFWRARNTMWSPAFDTDALRARVPSGWGGVFWKILIGAGICQGVLEDDLGPPSEGAELGRREVGDLAILERDAPGCRLDEPQDTAAESGLPAPALSDEAQHLAGGNRERHADPRGLV
jgi:hypothetical protein